jgi:hypothetical protein
MAVRHVVGVGMIVAAGTGLGFSAPTAQAEERQDPPVVQSLRLDGSDAYVTFLDRSDESMFTIIVVTNGTPSYSVATVNVPPSPGHDRVVTRQVSGMPPGQSVCAGVTAVGPEPAFASHQWSSRSFDQACADPASVPPDLVASIRGNESPQVRPSAAYVVEVRNDGGGAADNVTVDISTSGTATLADQAAVAGGWQANGFTCNTTSPTSMRCTGGKLDKGAKVDGAVMVGLTQPGIGAIHAQVSTEGDLNAGNNGTALNLRVS